MPTHQEDDIRRRAYQIWEDEGRPDGRASIHWELAEAEFGEDIAGEDLLEDDMSDDPEAIEPGRRGRANREP